MKVDLYPVREMPAGYVDKHMPVRHQEQPGGGAEEKAAGTGQGTGSAPGGDARRGQQYGHAGIVGLDGLVQAVEAAGGGCREIQGAARNGGFMANPPTGPT